MLTLRTIRLALWLAPLLLLAAGCGGGETGRPADANQAEVALNAVLEAWKQGGSPAELSSRAVPIHVTDADWDGGHRLMAYRTCGEPRLVGFDMSYPVQLELKSPNGKTVKKTAVYVVTTSPRTLVLRQEG